MATEQELMTTEISTDIDTPEQSALIKSLSENYETGRDTANQVLGKLQMAYGFAKMTKVVSLSELIKIKKNKLYRTLKGVSITLGDGSKIDDIGKWENFCKAIGSSKSKVDEDINNAHAIGLECFETLKKTGLTTQNFRDLRALSFEQREEFVDGINIDDKESITEYIDELKFKHSTEKAELTKKAGEAEETVKAARENTSDAEQKLNVMKEQEHMRQFKQEPWKYQTTDALEAMIDARTSMTQGVNQIIDVLNGLRENHELDEKALDLIAKSLLTEVEYNFQLVGNLRNDTFAILGSKYSPELSLSELSELLREIDETPITE